MKSTYNLRSIAATTLLQVVEQGQSLSQLLPALQRDISERDRGLLQEICFGVLRVLPQLDWYLRQLMAKPLIGKQKVLHYLLMVGLYQLIHTRIPPHAALAETVNGAVALKRPQLKGLINGVLRQFQREQEALQQRLQNNPAHYSHPDWLLQRLKKAYPGQWEQIVDANNQHPPMWLRVNRRHHTREAYLALLQEKGIEAHPHAHYPDAIRLSTPCAVSLLPGFEQGFVTVQDASAQGCIHWLSPQDHEDILDLCAAPGGKTTHILEAAPHARVLAVDVDEQRLKRVRENLQRLNLHAEVKCGDGRTPAQWCGDKCFDRILLDAPCSATGVIRRHPDIKWLRRDSDIAELASLQNTILEAIWPRLKTGGTLVYATCSVLPEENCQQIADFLQRHADAMLVDTGTPASPGIQMLPAAEDGDGFFYAKLVKSGQ
ncbi:16S rRNA (cytosine(967)-C(5))-methyltransferase RsmB [Dickeya zeae]|uniref:16S rRNA (cytosine(967)-C(5))-methyltransferase RsmB n=1 Tax=Dickeya zeae TaxID=204042 RepID=UPI000C9980D7|nr:16S rRNA (cytosine(967)-C(5))-methyltransferase RsmB [Dickeya zeae]AUQ26955.1 16S rRNA (cytosine(967)-C(5))-methyltransferase [Dickeya zeae]UJR60010.1 16S rRNA (cytosine(967)-C(5))-methyltransferase RsmB [Dickeya zeae]